MLSAFKAKEPLKARRPNRASGSFAMENFSEWKKNMVNGLKPVYFSVAGAPPCATRALTFATRSRMWRISRSFS